MVFLERSQVHLPLWQAPGRATRVYSSAAELPAPAVRTDGVQFETDVRLVELRPDLFVLNHPLRQEQVFGSDVLCAIHEKLTRGSGHAEAVSEHALLQALTDHGFLVAPGRAPEDYHRRLLQCEDRKEVQQPSFTLLRILLTDICNLACTYCKVIPNINQPIIEATTLQRLDEVIAYFFRHSEAARPKIIHITGGEPTLHFDRIEAIVELAAKHRRPQENYWLVLGTNATRIDAARAAFLARHDIKCIVSMDGPEDIHDQLRVNRGGKGSWRSVDRGIKLLKQAGAEVSLSMVLGQHTIERAEAIISWFLDEYAPSGLGVNFMKPPTPEQRDYDQLITPETYADVMYAVHRRFRDRGLFLELVYRKLQPFVQQVYRFHDCGAAAGTNLNLDAKGRVGPCKSFLVMNKLALTSLDADGYRDAVVSRWRKRSPIYYEACAGCAARGMCGNGCAYDAHAHAGSEMAIDERSCAYTKRFNQLFLDDLLTQVYPGEPVPSTWWRVPTRTEREKLLGDVRARPRTLSYSIGHQTSE